LLHDHCCEGQRNPWRASDCKPKRAQGPGARGGQEGEGALLNYAVD
jgi:hypothetical protein